MKLAASKWDLIKEGETIIDSHYMKQLLAYGIKLGETGRVSGDPAHLEMEAAVGLTALALLLDLIPDCSSAASCERAQVHLQGNDLRNLSHTFPFVGPPPSLADSVDLIFICYLCIFYSHPPSSPMFPTGTFAFLFRIPANPSSITTLHLHRQPPYQYLLPYRERKGVV